MLMNKTRSIKHNFLIKNKTTSMTHDRCNTDKQIEKCTT